MLAFVFLSLCKIFTSRWMLLTAQQQTCPIINCTHSTISPGKNTYQCDKIKSCSRCLVGSDIRLTANIVESNDILFCITVIKAGSELRPFYCFIPCLKPYGTAPSASWSDSTLSTLKLRRKSTKTRYEMYLVGLGLKRFYNAILALMEKLLSASQVKTDVCLIQLC